MTRTYARLVGEWIAGIARPRMCRHALASPHEGRPEMRRAPCLAAVKTLIESGLMRTERPKMLPHGEEARARSTLGRARASGARRLEP